MLVVDDYVQFIGFLQFVYLVHKKERILDFYRDYFNPLNFCLSLSANSILSSVVSQRTSPVIWITNLSLLALAGSYLTWVYFTFVYKLCAGIAGRARAEFSSKIFLR